MKHTTLRPGIWLVAIIASVNVPLWADGPGTGIIEGRVVDAQGDPLPGASVQLVGQQNTRDAISDAAGEFRFSLLLDGTFTVSAELDGLGSSNEVSVTLDPGERRAVDLTLRGGEAEEIQVVAEAPMINKYEPGATARIDAETAELTTFISRYYVNSLAVLPANSGSKQMDVLNSFMGGPRDGGTVNIDGVDVSQVTSNYGVFKFRMATTQVAATEVHTQGRGAEYGRTQTATINTVIKSGTNVFHGDFYYVAQNQAWVGEFRDYPDLNGPDKLINNYEASLGGPIYRDRAWFFGAHAELYDNRIRGASGNSSPDVIADPVFDWSFEGESTVAKVNFQPGDDHQLAATYVRTPGYREGGGNRTGDLFNLFGRGESAELSTASWNWGATPTVFTEFKIADSDDIRTDNCLHKKTDLSGGHQDTPDSNNFRYYDLSTRLFFNGCLVGGTSGRYTNGPRQQINAYATIFAGDNHELRIGAERHVMGLDTRNWPEKEYSGRGFGYSLPGGFATPEFVTVYAPPDGGVFERESELNTLFVQDRIDIGDKWVVTAGLRLEGQSMDNNIGQQVNDYDELAPRLSVVYDVNADGRLLIRGTAGRYLNLFNMSLTQNFDQGSNGTNTRQVFNWNPVTQAYDILNSSIVASAGREATRNLEPEYSDAYTLGVDWQFSRNWVAKASYNMSENDNIWATTIQFDENGRRVFALANWTQAEVNRLSSLHGVPPRLPLTREHDGIILELNRNFRNNWTLRANFYAGDAKGTEAAGNYIQAIGGLGADGSSDVNTRNKGNLPIANNSEFPEIFNVLAVKRWPIGKHTLTTGAHYRFRTGRLWESQRYVFVTHPGSGQRERVIEFLDPQGSKQLDTATELNLNASWIFPPINGKYEIKVGAELANALNGDAQLFVNPVSGLPTGRGGGDIAYQRPSEYRFNVAFSF